MCFNIVFSTRYLLHSRKIGQRISLSPVLQEKTCPSLKFEQYMPIENLKLPFCDKACKRLDKQYEGLFPPAEIPIVKIIFIAQKL